MHRLVVVGMAAACLGACDDTRPKTKAPPPPEIDLSKPATPPETPAARAERLAVETIIVDGHIDIPYRLNKSRGEDGAITEDISERTDKGDFDYPRAVAGGLDAPFMSIYVPADYQKKGGAKAFADSLIDMVEGFEAQWPDKFAVARSVADVEAAKAAGKVALPMGIENGAALEGDLANVAHFAERGVRYITLTHSKDNRICDSSYATTRTHEGLSDFGRKVVAEMNRVGIMVDVSHVSDDAFRQVMEVTAVPVIASHSSARKFTPGFERNMSDEMIQQLAAGGGVIMINFGSTFINQTSREHFDARKQAIKDFAAANKVDDDDPKAVAFGETWDQEHPRVYAKVTDVADHIDHVVKLVGVDHVGFGSDYDGVGDSLPRGLEDASTYPNLIRVLVERGYSDEDIAKMCSGNVLRVWREVEAYAAKEK